MLHECLTGLIKCFIKISCALSCLKMLKSGCLDIRDPLGRKENAVNMLNNILSNISTVLSTFPLGGLNNADCLSMLSVTQR